MERRLCVCVCMTVVHAWRHFWQFIHFAESKKKDVQTETAVWFNQHSEKFETCFIFCETHTYAIELYKKPQRQRIATHRQSNDIHWLISEILQFFCCWTTTDSCGWVARKNWRSNLSLNDYLKKNWLYQRIGEVFFCGWCRQQWLKHANETAKW